MGSPWERVGGRVGDVSGIGQRARLFPRLEARVYWAFAAIAPLPEPVETAVGAWHAELARHGVQGFGAAIAARDRLRIALAGLLGGPSDAYALGHGTTAGLIAVAHSYDWRAGDRVLIGDSEFPANAVPWRQIAHERRLGLDVVALAGFAERPERGLDAVERLLRRGGVRLVALSAVGFQTGLALPLAELAALCHRYRADLAIDAIQAAGIVPLDLAALGVDIAVGGGHKWLCATDGVGWVYVAPRARERIGPSMAGWLSFEDAARFLSEPGCLHAARRHQPAPRVLEAGSSSSGALFALAAGLELISAARPEVSLAHVQALHDRVEPALVALGFSSERAPHASGRSGILALAPPSGVTLAKLQAALARRGVVVSIPDGRMRLAPHFASTTDEADALLEAMPEALAEARA